MIITINNLDHYYHYLDHDYQWSLLTMMISIEPELKLCRTSGNRDVPSLLISFPFRLHPKKVLGLEIANKYHWESLRRKKWNLFGGCGDWYFAGCSPSWLSCVLYFLFDKKPVIPSTPFCFQVSGAIFKRISVKLFGSNLFITVNIYIYI